jgi:hypothetical protein
MEVDFVGYFNNISWKALELVVARLSHEYLGSLVKMYIMNIRTKFLEPYKPETELIMVKNNSNVQKETALIKYNPYETYTKAVNRKGMGILEIILTILFGAFNQPYGDYL